MRQTCCESNKVALLIMRDSLKKMGSVLVLSLKFMTYSSAVSATQESQNLEAAII